MRWFLIYTYTNFSCEQASLAASLPAGFCYILILTGEHGTAEVRGRSEEPDISAVGLWSKTEKEAGRYVFLLVTPSQTGRAKEAGREGRNRKAEVFS